VAWTWIRVVAFGVLLLAGGPAAAKAPTQGGTKSYGTLALAPAGDLLASLDDVQDAQATTAPHPVVVVRAVADGRVLHSLDPCATCKYADPAWSPAGDALAFVAFDPKQGTTSLLVAEGAQLRTVTTVKGFAATPRWSPDGKSIALLATIDARKEAGPMQAGAQMVGEIGEREDEQRIAIVPAAGGTLQLVSPPGNYVYEYDWTPDGTGFVATSAKGDGDNNWWIARLYAIDARTGTTREIAAPTTQISRPQVSPDGKTVAFIGGLMSDFSVFFGDIYTVPLAGGTPLNVTPGYRGSFTSLDWQGDTLLTSAWIVDHAALVAVTPATGATKVVWEGNVGISGGGSPGAARTNGRVVAFVAQDFTHAPALYAGPAERPQKIAHDNDALSVTADARSVTWSNDGLQIQGWLIQPSGTPRGKRPMVVVTHGGPAYASMPAYLGSGTARALLDSGYALFYPNPRGSAGQGEAFKRGNVRDFGGGDLRDVLTGIDKVLTVAPVDGNRLGITGHSYGGCMTMWAVTQSQRFKAAVASAGVSNWISYYGQNGINQWMIPYFGASAYDDPAVYRAASPIERIKQVTTPTLLLSGERDVEVPPPQSLEFWNGLRAMNVPTKLVIYQGEGHIPRLPAHKRDMQQRTVAWFDTYLKPPGTAGAAGAAPRGGATP
jgi:dipeptidyl aminopeptidase/acylaminoacyl peptidase